MNRQTHRIAHPEHAGVDLVVDDARPAGPVEPARGTAFFLPGFGSHRRGDKPTRLAADLPRHGWRFLALDFQGCGESGGAFSTFTLTRQLGDYVAARDALLRDQPHVLIGSSLGGLVAAMAAARDPERVKALVLIAPAFGFRERFEQRVGAVALERWERQGDMLYRGQYFETPLAFDVLRDARKLDEPAMLARLRAPTLVLHGTEDDVVPIAWSREAMRHVTAPLELVAIEGGSHRLEAHLGLLSAKILDFLGGFLDRVAPG